MRYLEEMGKAENIKVVRMNDDERFIFGEVEVSQGLFLFKCVATMEEIRTYFDIDESTSLAKIAEIYTAQEFPVSAVPLESIGSITSFEPTGMIEELDDMFRGFVENNSQA